MNKYLNIALTSAILLPLSLKAQNEVDALRYSQTNGAATARALSLGGAGGSYGGDFSSLSINPAGLGIYRSSELMITPTLRVNSMNGSYLGTNSNDNNTRFGIANLGGVFTTRLKKRGDTNGWQTISFGIGYNRVADFNQHGYYAGNNDHSSLTEGFAADAYANGPNGNLVPPYGYLGYRGYVLADSVDNYASIPYQNIIQKGGSLNQSKSWRSTGGVDEFTGSVGANYADKLMLGATLGITSYKYDRTTAYTEADATGNNNNDFDKLQYNEYLTTTGVGVNVKLGAIYKINDYFRVGGAFHTPTWSSFTDVSDYNIDSYTEGYKASLNSTDVDPHTFVEAPAISSFDYSLRTPWKGLLSATAFMGKYGFVTADYEYTAYNSMRYSFNNEYSTYEHLVNQAIEDTYRGTHTFRLGIEGKMDNFSARLGGAYYTSPYKDSKDFDGQRLDLSAGIGARFGGFFVDLAYVHIMQKNAEFAYPVNVVSDVANIKYGNNTVALTLGFKL
jgi:hypothetical protein